MYVHGYIYLLIFSKFLILTLIVYLKCFGKGQPFIDKPYYSTCKKLLLTSKITLVVGFFTEQGSMLVSVIYFLAVLNKVLEVTAMSTFSDVYLYHHCHHHHHYQQTYFEDMKLCCYEVNSFCKIFNYLSGEKQWDRT